jgi:hypothetical protein
MKYIKKLVDLYVDWIVEIKLKRWVKERRKYDYEFDRKHKTLGL